MEKVFQEQKGRFPNNATRMLTTGRHVLVYQDERCIAPHFGRFDIVVVDFSVVVIRWQSVRDDGGVGQFEKRGGSIRRSFIVGVVVVVFEITV